MEGHLAILAFNVVVMALLIGLFWLPRRLFGPAPRKLQRLNNTIIVIGLITGALLVALSLLRIGGRLIFL